MKISILVKPIKTLFSKKLKTYETIKAVQDTDVLVKIFRHPSNLLAKLLFLRLVLETKNITESKRFLPFFFNVSKIDL